MNLLNKMEQLAFLTKWKRLERWPRFTILWLPSTFLELLGMTESRDYVRTALYSPWILVMPGWFKTTFDLPSPNSVTFLCLGILQVRIRLKMSRSITTIVHLCMCDGNDSHTTIQCILLQLMHHTYCNCDMFNFMNFSVNFSISNYFLKYWLYCSIEYTFELIK